MAAASTNRSAEAPVDELDEILNYDVDEDIFRDVDTNMSVPAQGASAAKQSAQRDNGAGLGIDEEVKVVKTRKPIPKLDEDRLLSQAGIPKLRRTAKERLRFKGKGHEFSDAARLLQFYQLWLDELYPRAKFADGLAMIEKLGHKKRLQTMRREWINEGKPHNQDAEPDANSQPPAVNATTDDTAGETPAQPNRTERPVTPPRDENTDDDLYDATPQAVLDERRRKRDAAAAGSLFISDDEGAGGDPPSEDELDALLAEDVLMDLGPSAGNVQQAKPDAKHPDGTENFDDEMEAMAGMDDMW